MKAGTRIESAINLAIQLKDLPLPEIHQENLTTKKIELDYCYVAKLIRMT